VPGWLWIGAATLALILIILYFAWSGGRQRSPL